MESLENGGSYVGQRLALIRKELGRLQGEQEWTQTAVAQRTGLTQNILFRLEQGEGGKVESWLTVMNLYEEQGYNQAWIVTEDNRKISKFNFQQLASKMPPQQREALLKKLDKWQEIHDQTVAQIRHIIMQL